MPLYVIPQVPLAIYFQGFIIVVIKESVEWKISFKCE